MKKALIVFNMAILLIVSCGDSFNDVRDDITGPVRSVKLKSATSVQKGQSEQLYAQVYPVKTPDKSVTWSSSDETYVTVDQTGLVSGVDAGIAIVTVTTNDGHFTSECTVTVSENPVAVTGIFLNNITLNIAAGDDYQLEAGFTPQDPAPTNQNVTWTSSNMSIAGVSPTGLVHAYAPGTADITVVSADGGFRAKCTVTVSTTLPPAAPGTPVVTAGDSKLTVIWTSVSGATSYEVYYSTVNNSAGATTFITVSDTMSAITGLINGTPYYIWVKSKNSAGTSGFSSMATGIPVASSLPPEEPEAPAVNSGNKELSLTWTAVPDADSYEIWCNSVYNTLTATQVGGVISSTNYTISGLENGNVCYIWLKAVNAAGISGFGAVAWGTPEAPAGAAIQYSLPGVLYIDPIVINMKSVPGRIFPIKNDDSDYFQISNSYYLSEKEITYRQWSEIRSWAVSHGYTFANTGIKGNSGIGSEDQPVTTVNWRDAIVWCNALTEYYNVNNGSDSDLSCVYYSDSNYTTPLRTSTNNAVISTVPGSEDKPYIKASFSGNTLMAHCASDGFRLPSSMEWELAARWRNNATNTVAGYSGPYFTKGDSASDATANYNNSPATTEVAYFNVGMTFICGQKRANSLGLYDMSGNVSEWCFDWYNSTSRLTRGGYYSQAASFIQLGSNGSSTPENRTGALGFRLARTE